VRHELLRGDLGVGGCLWGGCCAGDGGLALWSRPAGGGFKPPYAALAEDRRGERCGKGAGEASGGDQEDVAQVPLWDRCWRVVRSESDIKTGVVDRSRDESGGCPLTGQAVSGMEAAW